MQIALKDIATAIKRLNCENNSPELHTSLYNLYKICPDNVEIKLSSDIDPDGELQFLSETRINHIFAQEIGQKDNFEETIHTLQNLKEIFSSISFICSDTLNGVVNISLDEPIGRLADPDFKELLENLALFSEIPYILIFKPTIERMLETSDKSDEFKVIHGFSDLYYPEYVQINKYSKRVFSGYEFTHLKDRITDQLHQLGIGIDQLEYVGQSLTISLPKNSRIADWIVKFGSRRFPLSLIASKIVFTKDLDDIDLPSEQDLIEFAIGGPVHKVGNTNLYCTDLTGCLKELTGKLTKDICKEYESSFGKSIALIDLASSDCSKSVLDLFPSLIRKQISPNITSLGLLTESFSSPDWNNSVKKIFDESLDVSSWQELELVSDDAQIISIDPNNAIAEIAFSVKAIADDGYEINAYILNSSRIIPVYSKADNLLLDMSAYADELGLYPNNAKKELGLSCDNIRPLICIKMIISADGHTEIDVKEAKGKVDFKLSYSDAEKSDAVWSESIALHKKVSAILKQSETSKNRISINEENYNESTYEFHMLTYIAVGNWCAQRGINIPFKVTEPVRFLDHMIPIEIKDPRMKNIRSRTIEKARESFVEVLKDVDPDIRIKLFKAYKGYETYSTNPIKGNWLVGVPSYAPIGGSIRRDTSRLALHQITEYINGHSGLSKNELDKRIEIYNQEFSKDYYLSYRKARRLSDLSERIGTIQDIKIQKILSRNSTQIFEDIGKVKYEAFYSERLTADLGLKVKIIAYDILNDLYRVEILNLQE